MRLFAAFTLLLAMAVRASSGTSERFAAQAARVSALEIELGSLVRCARSPAEDPCRRELDLSASSFVDRLDAAADEQDDLLDLIRSGRAGAPEAISPSARRAALAAHGLNLFLVEHRSVLHDSFGALGGFAEADAARLEAGAAEAAGRETRS